MVAIHSDGPPSYHASQDWETIKVGIPPFQDTGAPKWIQMADSAYALVIVINFYGLPSLITNSKASLVQCKHFQTIFFS